MSLRAARVSNRPGTIKIAQGQSWKNLNQGNSARPQNLEQPRRLRTQASEAVSAINDSKSVRGPANPHTKNQPCLYRFNKQVRKTKPQVWQLGNSFEVGTRGQTLNLSENTLKKAPSKAALRLDTSVMDPGQRYSISAQDFLHPDDISYQKLIGEGTFGKVFLAARKSTGEKLAIKRTEEDRKVKNREAEIALSLQSPFVAKVKGIYRTTQGLHQYLNIAMEHYSSNFFERLHTYEPLTELHSKLYAYQMVRGLAYIHSMEICHRDIKPQNMLVKDFKLVLCDFGSAKKLVKDEPNLSYICSRCYRAPQLIFGSNSYNTAIDMWSLGCVLLEVLLGKPCFIADSSLNHLLEVMKVLGAPSRQEVLDMNPKYDVSDFALPKLQKRSFAKIFPKANSSLIDFITKLLVYSPNKRPTAMEALAHPYFDQIRDEQSQIKLRSMFNCDPKFLFKFTSNELRSNPRAVDVLIPQWMSHA